MPLNEPVEEMLTPLEARVLGALMEKQMTTPDYYPLTLKALATACNQKSSRVPVMQLSQSEIAGAINDLRSRGLITARLDGRSDRYEQQLSRKLKLSIETRAILCVLILRGSLTINEIRINTSRMVEFSNNDDVEKSLEQLSEGEDPLILCLGRRHGQREDRYAHRLCGKPALLQPAAQESAIDSDGQGQAQRIAKLEQELISLKEEVKQLREMYHT